MSRAEAAARLAERIEARTAVATSIGLGFIGTTVMDALVAAGFETHSYDITPAVVQRYQDNGPGFLPPDGKPWSVGTDESVLDRADVVFVAVRGLIRPDRTLNMAPFRAVAEALKRHPKKGGRLVLMESTVPPGSTRIWAREWLGLGPDDDTFVCHSPERLSVGHTWQDFRRIPHLVGGLGPEDTALGARLLGKLVDRVVPVSAPESSELSKLLENAFMTVGISLIGEITRICHGLGITAEEVCAAAGTKPFGYFAFGPGPGVGGHCLPNDLQILRHTAHSLGITSAMLDGVNDAKDRMPGEAVDQLGRLLAAKGKKLAGNPVLLVGMGFKVGSADLSDTPATDIVREVRARGAEPVYIDSRVPEFSVHDVDVRRIDAAHLRPGAFDGCLVLAGDPALSAETLRAAVDVILDTGGGRALDGTLVGAERL